MIVVHDQHRNGRAVHDILSDTAENHPAQHAAIRPGDDDQFGVGCFSALRISYSVHQRFLLSRRISPACVGLLAPLGCEFRRGDFADAALGVGWNHDVENQNSDPSRTRIPHRKSNASLHSEVRSTGTCTVLCGGTAFFGSETFVSVIPVGTSTFRLPTGVVASNATS